MSMCSRYHPWMGDDNDRDLREAQSDDDRLAAARSTSSASISDVEERYLALFNSIEQGFCTLEVAFDEHDHPIDYRFLEISPSFEAQTGIRDGAGRWMREIAADQDQHWFDIYGDVAKTGKPNRFESWSTPLNRWWSVYAFRVGDPRRRQVGVLFNDITERKHAEAALQLFANANEALAASADYAGVIRAVASAAVESFAEWCSIAMVQHDGRLERALVLHRDPKKQQLADALQAQIGETTGAKRTIQTGRPLLATELRPADLARLGSDRTRLIEALGARSLMVVPLVGRGGPVGAMSFVRDAQAPRYGRADLSVAEEFGRRAGMAVENARLFERLREANAVKDEFLGLLSHELRNPLTTVVGLSGVFDRRMQSLTAEDQRDAARLLHRDALRLQSLIDNLLLLTRLPQGELESEPLLLHRLAEQAVKAFSEQFPDRVVALDAPAELPPVLAHEPWMLMVMANLLSNAQKYSPDDEPIDVIVAATGEFVSVSVLDRGAGLAAADCEHIFEPFFRAAATAEAAGGMGLGLALCKRLVELQGGTISCEARDGGGSVFSFSLPIDH